MGRTGFVAAAVAAAAVALGGSIGTAVASPPGDASGMFIQTSAGPPNVSFAGPNVVLESTMQGIVTGTLSGEYVESLRVVIHPNGTFTATGTGSCQCEVGGASGVIDWVVTDRGEELDGVPTFWGRSVINGGSGDLSGLRGVLQIEGAVGPMNLATIEYSGQIHSHP